MHEFRKPRHGTMASLTLALAVLAAPGLAAPEIVRQGPRPFAAPWEIRFQHVHDAMTQIDVELTQHRRVRDDATRSNEWITVEERLLAQKSSGGQAPRFCLKFVGVVGQTPPVHQLEQMRVLFEGAASSVHHYQSFRIHDLDQAVANYGLYYVGRSTVAGREVYVVVILPKVGDRSCWLLGLDLETAYPLYCGEVTIAGQLVSELVVKSFAHGANVRFPEGTWWQQPSPTVTTYPSAEAARTALPNPVYAVPKSAVLPAGYVVLDAHIEIDPLQMEHRLVSTYTDGIDFVSVVQKPTSNPPMFSGHAIGVFRDQAITQCVFRHGSLEVLVLGRGVEQRTQDLAAAFYRQLVGG